MKAKIPKIEYLILLVYTILTKFFVSINSIRFSEVFTDPDQAIFYSIGRAILNGKVLYKDVFDHKTPYIYFANAIAALFDKNHLGLFIIEIILMFVTLIYVYKFSRIYFSKTKSLVAALFIGVVLNINYITFGYSRTESYAIAFMMPALYLFSKYFECETSVAKEFNAKGMFAIGVLAGLTLMTNIRATILFVPFAMMLMLKLIKEKKCREIALCFVFGLLGVIASIIPYLIYMLVTNSVNEAIYAIFTTNANYVISTVDTGTDVFSTAMFIISENVFFYILLLISFISIIILKFNKYYKVSILLSLIIAFTYVTFSNRTYVYYLVILMPYFLAIYYLIVNFVEARTTRPYGKGARTTYPYDDKRSSETRMHDINLVIVVVLAVVCLIFSIAINSGINNRYINHFRRAEKIKVAAKNFFGDKKDLKVLGFGFLPEVYVYMNMIPDYKFFMIPNVSYGIDSTAFEQQYNYLLSRDPDLVVYREYNLNYGVPANMNNQIHYILSTSYELLDTIKTNEYEGIFYIFAKK